MSRRRTADRPHGTYARYVFLAAWRQRAACRLLPADERWIERRRVAA